MLCGMMLMRSDHWRGDLARLLGGRTVWWRMAVAAAVPVVLWLGSLFWERIPQHAGGLFYDVRVNRITGGACIERNSRIERVGGLDDLIC